MDKRLEKGHSTRERLIDVAARLFAEHGYEAVSIEAVLRLCEISRGALYHHFSGKVALFTAVLETVEARITQAVMQAAAGAREPLGMVLAGAEAWLELAATDPVVRRIVLIDAPAVLGWETWREIDGRHALGLLRNGLAAAAERGELPADRVDFYSRSLLAMLIEAALIVSRSDDPARDTQMAREMIGSTLAGFRTRQR
jgi:AcrR family transcriptional regulator